MIAGSVVVASSQPALPAKTGLFGLVREPLRVDGHAIHVKAMVQRIGLIVMWIATGGCVMHTLDAEAFARLPRQLSRLYYVGTEGEYHYFRGNVFLGADRRYRLPRSACSISGEFPRTSDRSLWIPWERSPSGAEGFRGEPSHGLER